MQDPAKDSQTTQKREPRNKGKLIRAKPPLPSMHVWSIRTKLQVERQMRDLVMFNLAFDIKLRGCDVSCHSRSRMLPQGRLVRL